jgi:enamine deaminase RidA (YjgF/YER057c/UK114 family)
MRRAIVLAALAAAAPAMAQEGARDRATVLMSEAPQGRSFQDRYGYADAVVIDGTIYMSGVVVGLAGEGDTLDKAYDRAFRAMGRTLERAGAGWRDVVDITSYHTDLPAQLDAMAAVKGRYITAPFPAWTAIQVTRLVPDNGLTEIKLVARMPRAGGR